MNLEPLINFLKAEAATTTGNVLTLPSSLTKDMAKELADKLPVNNIIHDLAVIVAKELGNQLTAMSLRPTDYADIKDLPDLMIERLIEELAKKPDLFFKTFKDHISIQG